MPQPTTEQLAVINSKFAREPLASDQVYVFPCKVIGDKLIPKYNMRLTANFLRKMEQQVNAGVALLIDHPWMKWEATSIPYGKTFGGRLQSDGDELALFADIYMVRGQEFEGIKTDSLASAIDAGTISETSAGFVTTVCLCSVCGDKYWGGSCPHINGRAYEIDGKDVICELIGDDGYLMEDSLVFKGAYEGAGIPLGENGSSGSDDTPQRYIPWNLADKSPPPDGRLYCTYDAAGGMNIYVSPCGSSGNKDNALSLSETSAPGKDEKNMEDQNATALSTANNLLTQVRSALGVDHDTHIVGAIQALTSKAQIADKYKTELIESACGSGVRAMGDKFNVESMKSALSHLPIEEIKKVHETYEAQALSQFGKGRQTQSHKLDNLPDDPNSNPQYQVDDSDETDESYGAAALAALKRTRGE